MQGCDQKTYMITASDSYTYTHVHRQCKGSTALKMGLGEGQLISGNSVGKQCFTSPALLGWVVW